MQIFKTPQLLANRLLLVVCLTLPWLNPFTSAPSASVIPLLLSWMLVSCALLLVLDETPTTRASSPRFQTVAKNKWRYLLLVWFLASALFVPEVVDRALTAGVLASIACVWIAMQIGKRAVNLVDGLLPWLLATWVLAATASSVLAVLQYLDMAHDLSPWVNQPRVGDAFANLRQRNQFASLTSIGLVALLGWVANIRNLSKPQMAIVWCTLAVLASGLACSVSRTGAIQWLVVVAWVVAWAWRQGNQIHRVFIRLSLGALLLVVFWSMVLPWIALERTGVMGASLLLRVAGQVQDYASCGGRRVLWSNALQMVVQHPWLGWGLGETDFAHYSTDYQTERFCDLLDNAHNFPLHLALEFGLPFALLFCVIATHWFFAQGKTMKFSLKQCIAIALLLVLGLHSLLEYPLWYGPFQITLGLALGMWSSSPRIGEINTNTVTSTPQHMFPMFVCCALFLVCLYAAWDYNRIAQIYKQPDNRDAAYRDNPLQAASQSWLFKNQADFARLMTQSITLENAQETYDLAMRVLHYSPEPRVVERAVQSLRVLGRDLEAEKLASRIPTITPHK